MDCDVVFYNTKGFWLESGNLQLPMHLMALSSCLRKEGFTVEIVDEFEREEEERQIKVLSKDALFLGITTMSGTPIMSGLRMAEVARESNAQIKLIWGGHHPSILPEETLKHPLVDIVVRGQGEETVVELAKALKGNKPLSGIKGITYKKNGKMIKNPDRPLEDINKYPMLDYDSLDMGRYIAKSDPDLYDTIGHMVLGYMSSRYCCHRCAFCEISAQYRGKWMAYTPERVAKELKHIVNKYNIDGVIFADDNFFVDRKRAERICDLIIGEKLNISWQTMCRANYIAKWDDSFMEKLRKSGCAMLTIGGESGSQRMLDYMRKDITVEDITRSAEKCKKHGIKTKFFFMMGLPTETEEEVLMTVKLMKKIHAITGVTTDPVLIYVAYSGTDMYKVALDMGFSPPKSLEEWTEYGGFLTFDPPWCGKKQKNLMRAVSVSSHFMLGYQTTKRYSKLWQKVAFWILRKDAEFRWKHEWFGYPYEWKLVQRYLRRVGF